MAHGVCSFGRLGALALFAAQLLFLGAAARGIRGGARESGVTQRSVEAPWDVPSASKRRELAKSIARDVLYVALNGGKKPERSDDKWYYDSHEHDGGEGGIDESEDGGMARFLARDVGISYRELEDSESSLLVVSFNPTGSESSATFAEQVVMESVDIIREHLYEASTETASKLLSILSIKEHLRFPGGIFGGMIIRVPQVYKDSFMYLRDRLNVDVQVDREFSVYPHGMDYGVDFASEGIIEGALGGLSSGSAEVAELKDYEPHDPYDDSDNLASKPSAWTCYNQKKTTGGGIVPDAYTFGMFRCPEDPAEVDSLDKLFKVQYSEEDGDDRSTFCRAKKDIGPAPATNGVRVYVLDSFVDPVLTPELGRGMLASQTDIYDAHTIEWAADYIPTSDERYGKPHDYYRHAEKADAHPVALLSRLGVWGMSMSKLTNVKLVSFYDPISRKTTLSSILKAYSFILSDAAAVEAAGSKIPKIILNGALWNAFNVSSMLSGYISRLSSRKILKVSPLPSDEAVDMLRASLVDEQTGTLAPSGAYGTGDVCRALIGSVRSSDISSTVVVGATLHDDYSVMPGYDKCVAQATTFAPGSDSLVLCPGGESPSNGIVMRASGTSIAAADATAVIANIAQDLYSNQFSAGGEVVGVAHINKCIRRASMSLPIEHGERKIRYSFITNSTYRDCWK